jgi:hypothetical protein
MMAAIFLFCAAVQLQKNKMHTARINFIIPGYT